MKVVIIEDEIPVVKDLVQILHSIDQSIEVSAQLLNVEDSISYFETHAHPDLIFSDIQLRDGLSFEIFRNNNIKAPIVFCTAYDDYFESAFKLNGIEYVLKPFRKESIESALKKFENLSSWLHKNLYSEYEKAMDMLTQYQKRDAPAIMVKYRDRTIPIPMHTIALFYLEYESLHLKTFNGNIFTIPESLDEIESRASELFFRVNRQFLINRDSILEIVEHFPRKGRVILKFDFKKTILVSKEKKSRLIKWLGNI